MLYILMPFMFSAGILILKENEKNEKEVERMTTKLKNLRRERRMTQKSLAKVFNISQTSVSKYETGEAVPDLETAVKMADFFGVSLDEFIVRES